MLKQEKVILLSGYADSMSQKPRVINTIVRCITVVTEAMDYFVSFCFFLRKEPVYLKDANVFNKTPRTASINGITKINKLVQL